MIATAHNRNIDQLDFEAPEEREHLRDMTRKFLSDHATEQALRTLMASDSGYDPDVWSRLAREAGLAGLLIPEEFGGSGLSLPDLQVVLEEMGRVLFCGPYLSTAVLAVIALLESGDRKTQARIFPAIAKGDVLATLAVEMPGGYRAGPDEGPIVAAREGESFVLNGTAAQVLDGHIAAQILTVAELDGAATLFVVEAVDLQAEPLPTFDQSRRLARVSFHDAAAKIVGNPGDAGAIVEKTLDQVVTALAAEQLGGAQYCLDLAVDYAKTRYQFGRPIGSFQAVKHKCADLLLDVETARSAVLYAAMCADRNPDELPVAACMAKSCCSEAYRNAAAENLQIHGGIGFTWEHSCHLHLKRSKSSEQLFGDPLHYRQRLARLLRL